MDTDGLIELLRDGRISEFNEERPAGLDLFGADLSELDLTGVDFSKSKLCKTDLSGSKLFSAKLDHADFEGADLTDAVFGDIDVQGASFRDAAIEGLEASGSFTNCDFRNSSWSGTATRGCRFVECRFDGAEFASSYFKRHNRFEDCEPEEMFYEEEAPKPQAPKEPDFLAPAKPNPKAADGVTVNSYQVEVSKEMADVLMRFLAKEGAAEDIAAGRISLRTFGDRLYLGCSAKNGGPLTDWVRFDLVRGTFYRSVELRSVSPDFFRKVAMPLIKRFRGEAQLTFTKRGTKVGQIMKFEDGREVPYEPPARGTLNPKLLGRLMPGLSQSSDGDAILDNAEPLPEEDNGEADF
jgi:hypothetical protein